MVTPLVEIVEQLPDPRGAGGQRYKLASLLLLVLAGLLSGHNTLNQIALWGQSLPREFLLAIGFKRGQAPGKSQLYEVMSRLDVSALEGALGAWAESVLAELAGTGAAEQVIGVALDGKSLRGSLKQAATIAHLLSAVTHGMGLTLSQVGVSGKTNEIPLALELLEGLLLEGRVFTMDALLTQRAIASLICEGGGDYIMAVKDNQPTLAADIALMFEDFSPSALPAGAAEQRRSRAH